MDTFERKETKYLLTPMQYIQFRALAEGHLAPAEFPEGDVSSIYYDTPDDTLINRSLEGGKYKEKLRVRSYGDGGADSPVYVEIKKKFKGMTYKRRVNCTRAAARAFLAGMGYEEAIERWPLADAQAQAACRSANSLQIAGEIAWMRDHYEGLSPKMRVDTHRISFVDADDASLRITFDSDVRWQQVGGHVPSMLATDAGAGHDLFANGERILEVKCGSAYPMWLVAVLNECGIRPQSVSKYGRAYQVAMKLALPQRRPQMAAVATMGRQEAPVHVAAPASKQAALRKRNPVAAVRGAFAMPAGRKPAHAGQR